MFGIAVCGFIAAYYVVALALRPLPPEPVPELIWLDKHTLDWRDNTTGCTIQCPPRESSLATLEGWGDCTTHCGPPRWR